jgi:hypothetical protein
MVDQDAMSSNAVPANSLAEIYLYLMIAPCPGCGHQTLAGGDAVPEPSEPFRFVGLEVGCKACAWNQCLLFCLPDGELAHSRADGANTPTRINPTGEVSRIIDVVGWVQLFRTISEAAAKTGNKTEARLIAFEAAQCLEEALRFYEDDNDLPPESALFSEDSRRHVREHPHSVARSRLVNLRAKLPSIDAMERALSQVPMKKPWWKLWGR